MCAWCTYCNMLDWSIKNANCDKNIKQITFLTVLPVFLSSKYIETDLITSIQLQLNHLWFILVFWLLAYDQHIILSHYKKFNQIFRLYVFSMHWVQHWVALKWGYGKVCELVSRTSLELHAIRIRKDLRSRTVRVYY